MTTLIAHECIGAVGGAENVFEQMRLALPGNRSVSLWNDAPDRFPDVEETWLASSPLRGRKVAALPFMGSAWRHVSLAGADRIVASSYMFSHHLANRAANAGIPAFAYVYTPIRYVWAPEVDSRGNSIVGRLGRGYFRRLDRRRLSTHVSYVAISDFVAQRMLDSWGFEPPVIYPPVDIERIKKHIASDNLPQDRFLDSLPREFVLGASRFVPYKNLDAAIRAGEVLGLPVVLAGAGPDEPRLRSVAERAKVQVTFAGRVSNDMLVELYRRAKLYVYMPVEDFGIMPVESIACGTPVLANEVGGARETVLATGGGVTCSWQESGFEDPSVVEKAIATDMTIARSTISKFSNESFRANFLSWVGAPPT
ncbi:MAG: glycosyltransferase [Actinomycetota bacterium]